MPCFTITRDADGRFTCQGVDSAEGPRSLDAVNAVCDMVVGLFYEMLRSNPQLFCLHCAAVNINGRLVLFPSQRKAGKSLLTAALADHGARVFSDDVVPLTLEGGVLTGLGNGVLPRLRLPLPENLTPEFGARLDAALGPRNAQYHYPQIASLAGHGERCPVGAIVLLDRQDGEAARLEPVEPGEVIQAFLRQNFARALHSGRILSTVEALVGSLPLSRLVYDRADEVPALLDRAFARWSRPLPDMTHVLDHTPQDAEFAQLDRPPPLFTPDRAYIQAPGLTEVSVDGATYLSDRAGLAVHRLNPGSQMIWRLIEEPMDVSTAAALMADVYPEEDAQAISDDCLHTFEQFVAARLAQPA